LKKKKKILKVQEFSDEIAQDLPSEEKKDEDASQSDHHGDLESQQDSKSGDDLEDYRSVSSDAKESPSVKEESVIEEAESEEGDHVEKQDSCSNGEPEVAEIDEEVALRVHQKT